MPAIDAPRGNNAAAKPPPVPKAKPSAASKPAPVANLQTSNNPRGVAIAPVRTPAPPRMLTSSNNPRGTAIIQPSHGPTPGDVQATHPDPKTTVSVFRAQPLAQQQQIVKGALQHPTVPASKIILDYLKAYPGQASQFASVKGGGVLPALAKVFNPANVYGARSAGADAAGAPKGNFGAVMFGGPSGAKQLLANAGKDVVNLPGEALSTAGTLGGDVLARKPGKALSDLASPFVQLAEHPAQSFYQHPLDTALMFSGAAGGVSRLAAAPIRAFAPEGSLLGRAVSTERPSVSLTGNLTHERPPYSKSPTIKAGQVAFEKAMYTKAPTGELIPRRMTMRDKQIQVGVSHLSSAIERIRRVNREAVVAQREKAVLASKPIRAAKSASKSLKYGHPEPAVIPGAAAYARLADLTVRNPTRASWVADLQKHLDQISVNRPNLADNARLLKEHDATVKLLKQQIAHPPTDKQLQVLAAKIEQHRQEFAPVQEQLRQFGHFGPDMTKEGLFRREAEHYVTTHMGGRVDPALGLMRAADKAKVRALRSNLIQKANRLESEGGSAAVARANELRQASKTAWETQTVPVKTGEITAHMHGPEGTGGRMPLYTPDRPRTSSSFYIKSEKLPMLETKRNMLWAYTHGLTEPGHAALTLEHVHKQGLLDAYKAQRAYLDQLKVTRHGTWGTHQEALKGLEGTGLKPINVAETFHPPGSIEKAYEGTHPAQLEEEAARLGLDLSERLKPGAPGGRWAGIDPMALKALKAQEAAISPGAIGRAFRGLNTQFREVALGTSAKHIPGVMQEGVIRDIAYGIGFRSWLTGRGAFNEMRRDIGEAGAREQRAKFTGGQAAGMTTFAKTHSVAENYRGTNMYPVLKGWESFVKTPGPRQARTAWKAWSQLIIKGTKKAIEENQQTAAMGKYLLDRQGGYVNAAKEHGFVTAVSRLLGLHGKLLEDATRGLYDPRTARQARVWTNRVMGTWTDLTPSGKTAVMFSPFGLWWMNSVKFIARMPIDQPVKTGVLASATVGTQQERQAQGLDMFSPGALPLYEQGGIPVGGKILAQNYYSPFGVANDPLETAQSLIAPTVVPIIQGAGGVNWLFRPLSSPGQNTNRFNEKDANAGQRIQAIADALLSSFVPLYTKAEQIASGGASEYDVSPGGVLPPLVRGKAPATKTPGKGLATGLKKATLPVREYKTAAPSGGSSGWGGGSSGSSSGGWGGGTTSSTGGWG